MTRARFDDDDDLERQPSAEPPPPSRGPRDNPVWRFPGGDAAIRQQLIGFGLLTPADVVAQEDGAA
ncbi:MAG: hypothetical protein ABI629_07930 [bacterium]